MVLRGGGVEDEEKEVGLGGRGARAGRGLPLDCGLRIEDCGLKSQIGNRKSQIAERGAGGLAR